MTLRDHIRERYEEIAGEAIAEILDRLYIGETLRHLNSNGPGCPHDGVHYAACRHLNRLPAWRLLLARWALGTRSVDDRIEDILTDHKPRERDMSIEWKKGPPPSNDIGRWLVWCGDAGGLQEAYVVHAPGRMRIYGAKDREDEEGLLAAITHYTEITPPDPP